MCINQLETTIHVKFKKKKKKEPSELQGCVLVKLKNEKPFNTKQESSKQYLNKSKQCIRIAYVNREDYFQSRCCG